MKNNNYVLAGIAVVIAMAAIAYLAIGSLSPAVKAGDTIGVYFTGTFTNGTVFDSNVGQAPLNFTVGSGQLIKGFDQGVLGMRLGQNRTITVPPSEGYGYVNSSLIVSVPLGVFGNQSNSIVTGAAVMRGYQRGIVAQVNATNATINFNSPLVGKTLVFNVKVVSIKS